MQFRNRMEAGRLLAKPLAKDAGCVDLWVLALPRGGVPVASEVARALNAPLDVLVVRKLGVPGREELALGAIATGGVRVLNQGIVDTFGISAATIDAVADRETRELERREQVYRGNRPLPDLKDRWVIVVDDGIATGATVRAAIAVLRHLEVGRLVVATPTVSSSTANELRPKVDELVALITPSEFFGVGDWYEDFEQTTDEQVRELLAKAKQFSPSEDL